jgi:hypothetical protein
MQTFLPWEDFEKTAACLDRQRLGKQRVETLMIARIMAGQPSSWKNHPAVLMWRGCPATLLDYQAAICFEWKVNRGYSDNCLRETQDLLMAERGPSHDRPWWLGDEEFHLSHRANLRRKDPAFYADFEDLELGYRWPTEELGVWREPVAA